MAKNTLREYLQEIESMIESDRLDEAIAHSRTILQLYPKHVAAYRLLGKALLERKSYADASDVMQRVLSCIPDDFVAHLGMSILREEGGDLDAAIWHMERAFEGQPANAVIQEELRRLYGKRDGLEPAKIQLTRGALARMYAKGDLYPQAIAELRSALAEDPQRADLQVLLARMYVRSGQRLEAAETCSTLLSKFPFCLEANQILAEILAGTERAGEAEVYRQRVASLEPYAAFTSPERPTPESVPDEAISLEPLEYVPGQALPILPAVEPWEAPLAAPEGELGAAEPPPDWLASLEEETPMAEILPEEPAPLAGGLEPLQPEATGLPEWMQGAGEAPAAAGEETAPEEAAEAGEELPDWLLAAAPPAGEAETPEPARPEAPEGLPPWLEAVESGEQVAEPRPEQPPAEEMPSEEGEAAPVGIEAETPPARPEEETSFPEWVSAYEEELPAMAEAAPPAESAEIPEWLQELQEAPLEQAAEPAGEEAGELLPPEEAEPLELAAAEIPEWLHEPAEPAPSPEEAAPAVPSEVPDWLIAALGETEPTPTPEQPAGEGLQAFAAESFPEEPPPILGDTKPMRVRAAETGREEPPAEAIEAPEAEAPVPGAPLTGEEEIRAEVLPEAALAAPFEEGEAPTLPEAEGEEAAPGEPEAPPAEGVLAGEAEAPVAEPAKAPFEWMPEQAAEPEAVEEEEIQPLEEGELPEWLRESMEAGPGGAPMEALAAEEEGLPAEGEIPDWLKEPAAEAPEAETAPPEALEEGLPEWLRPAPEEAAEEEIVEAEIAEWVEAAPTAPEPAEEAAPGEAPTGVEGEELPAWLPEFERGEAAVEEIPWAPPAEAPPPAPARLDLNAASLAELERLPAIGFIQAQHIVSYREAHGPFTSLEQLNQVPGLASETLEEIKEHLTVTPPTPVEAPAGERPPEIAQAWSALVAGDVAAALERYNGLIRQEKHLEQVIHDLREATFLFPVDVSLYQALGDAHLRANQLQEALAAYNKAEDLLR